MYVPVPVQTMLAALGTKEGIPVETDSLLRSKTLIRTDRHAILRQLMLHTIYIFLLKRSWEINETLMLLIAGVSPPCFCTRITLK